MLVVVIGWSCVTKHKGDIPYGSALGNHICVLGREVKIYWVHKEQCLSSTTKFVSLSVK